MVELQEHKAAEGDGGRVCGCVSVCARVCLCVCVAGTVLAGTLTDKWNLSPGAEGQPLTSHRGEATWARSPVCSVQGHAATTSPRGMSGHASPGG